MGYVLLFYGNDISTIIRKVDLLYLPLIFLLSILQYVFSAWRWYFIASKTQSLINYNDALKYYYISGFLNNILPSGVIGDIYRTMNIKVNNRNKGSFLKSFQSVLFERLSGQITLIITFIFSLALFFLVNHKYTAFLYVVFIIFTGLSLVKIFFIYQQKNKFIINFKYIFSGKRFYKHFFLSLIIVLTYITTYIICAFSLNLDIDIISFFVFAPIILFSMTLPVSIGGWGVRETTALLISFLLGLSVSASVTVSIVYGLMNLACSLPGMYFLFNKTWIRD
tara:strand:- start:2289 stop:3128 length:840 start_codon:yes stop_codon:yes gene_type:complete